MHMDVQVPWSPWMGGNGLSLCQIHIMVHASVPSRREAVNPVRPGREQPQRWIRVPRCSWCGRHPYYFHFQTILVVRQGRHRVRMGAGSNWLSKHELPGPRT